MNEYEIVIGLEVHVELSTKTKIFCSCPSRFGGTPNTRICPVCTGMPGALPVLNKNVVEYALKVAIATDCEINRSCFMDRKNYYYPDSPRNYQISQLYVPLCHDGFISVDIGKKIRIHEIHMEDDAGKLVHDALDGCTLIDYNRAGVPLIEIVTEPDMRSADEVIGFLEELKTRIDYLGVSDCKLEEGSMRVDVNLSVRRLGEALGTRTEMKNLNSLASIRRAIDYESKRQIALIESGGVVEMETLRWDDVNGKAIVMRSKEERADYRYFPEPDMGKIVISEEEICKVRESMPVFRRERIKKYEALGIPEASAAQLTLSKRYADFFEEVAALTNNPVETAKWMLGEVTRIEGDMKEAFAWDAKSLSKVIVLYTNGKISLTSAKEVYELNCRQGVDIEEYLKENNLYLITGDMQDKLVREAALAAISENPESVADYKKGRDRAMGYIVGQVMKKGRGSFDPRVVSRVVKELLDSMD